MFAGASPKLSQAPLTTSAKKRRCLTSVKTLRHTDMLHWSAKTVCNKSTNWVFVGGVLHSFAWVQTEFLGPVSRPYSINSFWLFFVFKKKRIKQEARPSEQSTRIHWVHSKARLWSAWFWPAGWLWSARWSAMCSTRWSRWSRWLQRKGLSRRKPRQGNKVKNSLWMKHFDTLLDWSLLSQMVPAC